MTAYLTAKEQNVMQRALRRSTTQLPLDVRNGGRSADKEHPQSGAEVMLQDPHSSVSGDEQRTIPPHSYRYVAERGSGSAGTAYNQFDYEVIDLGKGNRRSVIARAPRQHANLICVALNLWHRDNR